MKNITKKIIFMGTPSYATIILKSLLDEENFKIIALFTQQDKKGNRNKITLPHIKEYINNNNINIDTYQPNKLSSQENIEILKKYNPDFIIVAAYGQLLSEDVLSIAPCINLHASILPKYRGASPIQEYIISDDKYTGITAMLMNKGLDTGDILSFCICNGRNKNTLELMDELAHMASKLTIKTIKNFHNIKPVKQHSSISSYAKKIKKSDGKINFTSANEVYKKYLAYQGWPGIFMENGIKIPKLEINEENSNNDKEGIILSIEKEYIIISALKGSLKIFSLHPPSKKPINAYSFIIGRKLKIADSIL
jgi:methionyl-tRNA formyltransferase